MSEIDTPKDDQVVDEKPVQVEDSEFAYLERDHFTSEKFKIEIRNLPKYYGMAEVKKLLQKKLNLDACKVKRPHNGSHWIYVCFRSEEARDAALTAIDGYKWKGKDLKAETASAVPDPLVMKRKNTDSQNDNIKKIKCVNDIEELYEQIKDATTPLWREPYENQIATKEESARALLKKLSYDLVNGNPSLKDWVDNQRKLYDGLPCEMLPIRPSPMTQGYRNKCEFTIGINELTGEKTVGMRIGSYAKGSLCVVSPEPLPHVSDIMKKACRIVEKFIRLSPLDIYNQETHEGYWKSLTARQGFKTNQLMLMFVLNPQKLTEDELSNIEKELRSFFESEECEGLKVDSLLLATSGKSRECFNVKCVSGGSHIYEEVCDRKFRISSHAFFQTNTSAAEVLFNTIGELSGITEDTSLIDICCGAGTIAICLSKDCGEVLGLEKWAEAIEDAKKNAEANGVENAQFFAGCAEDIISSVMNRATKPNVVAVVDPPRAGLEKNAVAQLRKTKQLNQFVYASCHPELALKNFVDFGRSSSKQYPSEPFVPVKCVAVDMFPHTKGYELVVFFKRFSLCENKQTEQ